MFHELLFSSLDDKTLLKWESTHIMKKLLQLERERKRKIEELVISNEHIPIHLNYTLYISRKLFTPNVYNFINGINII